MPPPSPRHCCLLAVQLVSKIGGQSCLSSLGSEQNCANRPDSPGRHPNQPTTMLVTFLVFASIALVLLITVLWYIWPASRLSTSVPGLNPSVEALGNIPDIRDAGGLTKFLEKLHCDHGMIASFWINDFLAISLGSRNIFKLVIAGNKNPYQSIVPVTTDQDVLENSTKDDSLINKLLSSFAPFGTAAQEGDLEDSVIKLVDELVIALKQLGDQDQIPIEDYMTALAVRIVCETSPSVTVKGLDPTKLRSLYATIAAELDLCLDFGGPVFDAEQKRLLSRHLVEFSQIAEASEGKSTVLSQIIVISSLASWALYYLAKQEVLQTMAEPQLSVFLAEVVRVTGFIPIRSKVTSQSVTVLGHTIEEGTMVINALNSFFWDEKIFPNPGDIDIRRTNSPDGVLSFIHPEVASSYGFRVVRLIVRQFLQSFVISLAQSDFIAEKKFRLVVKPACDVWLKLKLK